MAAPNYAIYRLIVAGVLVTTGNKYTRKREDSLSQSN